MSERRLGYFCIADCIMQNLSSEVFFNILAKLQLGSKLIYKGYDSFTQTIDFWVECPKFKEVQSFDEIPEIFITFKTDPTKPQSLVLKDVDYDHLLENPSNKITAQVPLGSPLPPVGTKGNGSFSIGHNQPQNVPKATIPKIVNPVDFMTIDFEISKKSVCDCGTSFGAHSISCPAHPGNKSNS